MNTLQTVEMTGISRDFAECVRRRLVERGFSVKVERRGAHCDVKATKTGLQRSRLLSNKAAPNLEQ